MNVRRTLGQPHDFRNCALFVVGLVVCFSAGFATYFYLAVAPIQSVSRIVSFELAFPAVYSALGIAAEDAPGPAYIRDQAELLTSEPILRRVVAHPTVQGLPTVANSVDPIALLRAKLTVRASHDGKLIRIALDLGDQEEAAAALDVLISLYLTENRMIPAEHKALMSQLMSLVDAQPSGTLGAEANSGVGPNRRSEGHLRSPVILAPSGSGKPRASTSADGNNSGRDAEAVEWLYLCESDLRVLDAEAQLEAFYSRQRTEDGSDSFLAKGAVDDLTSRLDALRFTAKIPGSDDARSGQRRPLEQGHVPPVPLEPQLRVELAGDLDTLFLGGCAVPHIVDGSGHRSALPAGEPTAQQHTDQAKLWELWTNLSRARRSSNESHGYFLWLARSTGRRQDALVAERRCHEVTDLLSSPGRVKAAVSRLKAASVARVFRAVLVEASGSVDGVTRPSDLR
jgi:hypothetical protein